MDSTVSATEREHEDEYPERYTRRQRIAAGVLVLLFFLVAVITTALSLGTYCLTTDGADTRALSETVRSLFGR